jgi:hypothetical protein
VINNRCQRTIQDSARPAARLDKAGLRSTAGFSLVTSLGGRGYNPFASSVPPPPVVEKCAPRAADDYIIGSGDELSSFVDRNPELGQGGVAVRLDGRTSTPMIEDIVAAANRAVLVRIDPDGKRPTIKVRLSDLIKDGDIDQNF